MKFFEYISLSIFLFILSINNINGQDRAFLDCLEVQPGGSVTLHWSAPDNVSAFVRYVINYSSNGGTFAPIAEIDNPSQTQFTHTSAQANQGSRYYYLTTVYSNISLDSETLQTIFLQVDDTDPLYAKLYWNQVSDPPPGGSSEKFMVLKEYPINSWEVIDTVSGITYDDPIIVCLDTITYQIRIENDNGCSSVSNLRGGWFEDLGQPAIPLFDSVSIQADNRAILGWTSSASSDVTGYIIYRYENEKWIEIDRVQESTSTTYTDQNVDPCSEIISYAIAAIDSCGNKSEGTFEDPTSTILLNEVENNVCAATNILSWSAYENAKPDLEGYKIFYSENGSTFTEVGLTSPDTLSFAHDSVETGVEYTYYVQAIFGENSSSSCHKSVTTSTYQKPSFVYLANADVLPNYHVELTIDVDTMVYACTWEIWRSDTNGNDLNLIKSITRSELKNVPLTYTDTTARAWEGFYIYQVKVLDSCERKTQESEKMRSIFLEGSLLDEDNILLQWNAFEGWDEGVDEYYIFRMTGGTEPTLPIDSVDAQTLDYIDDVTTIEGSSEPVTYWVQAIQKTNGTNDLRIKSNSNRIGAALESDMYVANAYRPGIDAIDFKPVYRFFSGTDYLFQIFNRWGQLIFESNNPDLGWDGKQEGQYVPLGTYVYTLGYKNLDATSVSKKGTVTVIY